MPIANPTTGISTNGSNFTSTPAPQDPVLISSVAQYGPEYVSGLSSTFVTFQQVVNSNIVTQTGESYILPGATDPTEPMNEFNVCSVQTDNVYYAPSLSVGDTKSHTFSGTNYSVATFGAVCYPTDKGYISNAIFSGPGASYSFNLVIGPDQFNGQLYACSCEVNTIGGSTTLTMTRFPNLGTYPDPCNPLPPIIPGDNKIIKTNPAYICINPFEVDTTYGPYEISVINVGDASVSVDSVFNTYSWPGNFTTTFDWTGFTDDGLMPSGSNPVALSPGQAKTFKVSWSRSVAYSSILYYGVTVGSYVDNCTAVALIDAVPTSSSLSCQNYNALIAVPEVLTFNYVEGSSSAPQTITLTNVGNVNTTLVSLFYNNGNIDPDLTPTFDYTGLGGALPSIFTVDESKTFTLSFSGGTVGVYNRQVQVLFLDANTNLFLNITVNVTAPAPSPSP